MWIRQLFGGSKPPKYLTDVDQSTIWGVYTSKKFGRMYVRQIFRGFTPPKYLTDVCPSDIWGALHPQKI